MLHGPKLVLKRFEFSQAGGGENLPLLLVEGRAAGLIAFLLNLMKLDPTTTLTCYSNRVEIATSSLSGRQVITIPNSKITGIQGGHRKSLGLLVTALIFSFQGMLSLLASIGEGSSGDQLMVMGWSGLFFGLLFLFGYLLSRKMNLFVMNGGDTAYGLNFGQGVLEGVLVDANRVEQAVALLTRMAASAPRT